MFFSFMQMTLNAFDTLMSLRNRPLKVFKLAVGLFELSFCVFKTMCHLFNPVLKCLHHAVQFHSAMPLFASVLLFHAMMKFLFHTLGNFVPASRMQILDRYANVIFG